VVGLSVIINHFTTGCAKTGLFLRVDNYATVSDRKASDMPKVSKFCLEKSVKLV